MIGGLRQVGDPRTAEFDAQSFRLLLRHGESDAGVLNLGNLYAIYCKLPRAQRAAWLKATCLGLASPAGIPDDFEDARPDLLPAVRTRSFVEVARHDALVEGADFDVPYLPLSDHLVVCLAYDLPSTMHFINQHHLQRWDVSLYEALEVARHNLDRIQVPLMSLGDKLFVIESGDGYDASRLLCLDKIRQLPIVGQPVAIALTRDTLLLADSDNPEGLEIMAELAELKQDEPRPISSLPVRLVDDSWETWIPPDDHPHYPAFRKLAIRYWGQEYADQKARLDAWHAQQGIDDVFVASFAEASKGDETFSFCTWPNSDSTTWLPKTERIAFYDPDAGETTLADWDQVHEMLGYQMEALDCFPPRWRVDTFPEPEQLNLFRLEL